MEKIDKQKSINAIGEVVNCLAESIKKDENEFILEMVATMKATDLVMRKARRKGIKVDKLMPKIKEAYLAKNIDKFIKD